MPAQISVVDLTASDPPAPAVSTSPATVPIDALLHGIISSASENRLRDVLHTICEKSQEALKIAQDLLLVSADKVRTEIVEKGYNGGEPGESDENEKDEEDGDSGSSDGDAAPEDSCGQRRGVLVSTGGNLKRLRPRFTRCENCCEAFDVETNEEESCIWHPGTALFFSHRVFNVLFSTRSVANHSTGKSEVNEVARCWDDYEDWREGCPMDERFDDMPEGFVFDCCGRVGTSEGCKIGTHVEASSSSKRARY